MNKEIDTVFSKVLMPPDMKGFEGTTFYPIKQFTSEQLDVIYGKGYEIDAEYIAIRPEQRDMLISRLLRYFSDTNAAQRGSVSTSP